MKLSEYMPSIEACAAHYGEEALAVRSYMIDGHKRAKAMENRGPIRFDAGGRLAPEIRSAYSRHGFYVFTGVIKDREMSDIHADLRELRSRFPTHAGAELDAEGRPALGVDCNGPGLLWSKPLSDPMGGTEIANGRHKIKLRDLKAAEDAPQDAPFILMGSLQFSDSALRLYAHPELLRIAADINGDDFAPFNEVLFIKDAGLGSAVSWHQDGDTHWDHPDFDEGIHGFNFMAQVFGSTAVNGVWVVPGTHRLGRVDVKELVAESGSERIEDAVPLICDPGDVVICNRQIVHGSFANPGFEPRLTINFGFHRRTSVLGVKGAGIHSAVAVYDEDLVARRTRALGYAIAARRAQYPDEESYRYRLFDEQGDSFVWDAAAREDLKDYNLLDLSI